MSTSMESTLFRLAFRQLTSSRRAMWALLLAALPVLLALIIRAQGHTGDAVIVDLVTQYQVLIVGVLLPLIALVVGTGVFGQEIEDGTVLYVLGKPVERWRIVLARLAASTTAVAAVMVPCTLVSGLIITGGSDPLNLVTATTLSVAVGGFLYCALFIALSLSTKRALVAGLGYVVIWEGLLSNAFAGTRALSVRQYTVSVADALSSSREPLSRLGITTALVMAAVIAVLATLHAIRRLRTFEIGEAV